MLGELQSGLGQAAVDATFATTGHKDGLVAELLPGEAASVSDSVATTLDYAWQTLDPEVTRTAAEWLAGDDLYEVRAPAVCPAPRKRPVPVPATVPESDCRPAAGARLRNVLVTNAEMA
ncbi:hypothetical protein [Streptomyces chartreusis]